MNKIVDNFVHNLLITHKKNLFTQKIKTGASQKPSPRGTFGTYQQQVAA